MRAEKKQMVEELSGLLKDRSAVLISYQGLTANVLNGFRAEIASEGVNGKCQVIPNKLLKKAAAALGYDDLSGCELHGDTALLSGPDAVSLLKCLKAFIAKDKNKDIVKVKLGYVDGELLNAADTLSLADLPSKEAIQGQILGLLQAPASGIVRALNAKLASILYVLNAYIEKKEKQTA